jgi:hypothetical protein
LFLGVYNGLSCAFYWPIFHYFFTKKLNGDDTESKVGFLFGFPKIFTILAPVIGALIINFFSFEVLFVVVSIILFVSLIPLFGLKDHKLSFKFDYEKLFDKSFLKYILGFIVDGSSYVVNYILLPLFIFLTFSQTLEVGFFSTLVSIGGFLTPIIISYMCKGKTSFFIQFGAILSAIVFISIFFISTQLEFFFLGFLVGTFSSFWNVPFYARMYKHAKKTNTLEFFVLRASIMNFARVFVFLLMILFYNFNLAFITNIISHFLMLAF